MSSITAMTELVAAARILKVHALALVWVLEDDDDAEMPEALEVLWAEALAAVGGDHERHSAALALSIVLWPNPAAR